MIVPDKDTGRLQDNKSDAKRTEKKKKVKKSKKAEIETGAVEDTEKPKIKKRTVKAMEIDITQSKRLVKPKRTVKRKVVKVRKAEKEPEPVVKARNIGIEVALPTESCLDPHCPFHGSLSVRGQILTGVVVSSKMDKTTIVQREILRYVPKYERYEKRTHKYSVHNPQCVNAQRGDMVKIMECRPLSKSKSFVVIEKL